MNQYNNHFIESLNLDKCNSCPVSTISFCTILDEHGLEEFSAMSTTKIYSDSELIFTEGKVNQYVGSIIEGIVKIYKLLDDGRQQIVSLAFPGDLLGNIIDPEYSYFAEAIGQCKICFYQVSRINNFAESNPLIYRSILTKTNEQLSDARDWLLLLGRKSAKEKIASFLLLLADRNNAKSTQPRFKIPLKRQEIADFLGLTIETVSRNFSNFKNQQIIREQVGHMVTIVDFNLLKSIS